jgi:hypothetical protein
MESNARAVTEARPLGKHPGVVRILRQEPARPSTVFQLEGGTEPYQFRMFYALAAAQKAGLGYIPASEPLGWRWVPGSKADPRSLRSWVLTRPENIAKAAAVITEYAVEDA